MANPAKPPSSNATKPTAKAIIETFDILGYVKTDHKAIDMQTTPVIAMMLIRKANLGTSHVQILESQGGISIASPTQKV
ncbi:hypothetical protein OQJ59_15305 [Microbulbifer thermotolerans]|uniref:hypothetical protein n=1 Tax=Microbulbifer thermotolerans TaxID=252514 RepID=UPI00224A4A3A|nr:hypothetical protein [Microbulbifer thermotolerans]MCX2842991.1 hypothetical protein [Microbulbifer thermotolerans]